MRRCGYSPFSSWLTGYNIDVLDGSSSLLVDTLDSAFVYDYLA